MLFFDSKYASGWSWVRGVCSLVFMIYNFILLMMTSCLHEIVRRVVSHCFQSQCGTHVSSKSESYKCKSATTMSLNQHREDNKKKDNTCCVAQFYTVLLRNMYVNHEDIH